MQIQTKSDHKQEIKIDYIRDNTDEKEKWIMRTNTPWNSNTFKEEKP